MSDNLIQQALFLSTNPPTHVINDYSGTLSSGQISSLESQITGLHYKAKIVVLPKDYTPGTASIDEFSRQMAEKLHLSGNKLLLVVDLKGHHVRAEYGDKLQQMGVNKPFIDQLAKSEFVPYMK